MLLAGCTAPAASIEVAPTEASAQFPEIVIRAEAPEITISTETPTAPATKNDAPSTLGPIKSTAPTSNAEAALDLLDEIVVKGRAPQTGYDRDLFGNGWGDPDHNGCDTRNDILSRDLMVSSYKEGTRDCVVLTGILQDPYTGKTIDFQRGQGTSNDVQIDHIVALSDAWQKGAQQLPAQRRIELANDPINLIAVDGPTNAAKSDSDAASWLPPQRDYWCQYVSSQVTVKHKYGLWMTAAEHERSNEVLKQYC